MLHLSVVSFGFVVSLLLRFFLLSSFQPCVVHRSRPQSARPRCRWGGHQHVTRGESFQEHLQRSAGELAVMHSSTISLGARRPALVHPPGDHHFGCLTLRGVTVVACPCARPTGVCFLAARAYRLWSMVLCRTTGRCRADSCQSGARHS